MRTLTVRELHLRTGHWVRAAHEHGGSIVITERGRPVATLIAYDAATLHRALPPRSSLKKPLPKVDVDSATVVSAMRDRS
jgi:prevent-host-death family protein